MFLIFLYDSFPFFFSDHPTPTATAIATEAFIVQERTDTRTRTITKMMYIRPPQTITRTYCCILHRTYIDFLRNFVCNLSAICSHSNLISLTTVMIIIIVIIIIFIIIIIIIIIMIFL